MVIGIHVSVDVNMYVLSLNVVFQLLRGKKCVKFSKLFSGVLGQEYIVVQL